MYVSPDSQEIRRILSRAHAKTCSLVLVLVTSIITCSRQRSSFGLLNRTTLFPLNCPRPPSQYCHAVLHRGNFICSVCLVLLCFLLFLHTLLYDFDISPTPSLSSDKVAPYKKEDCKGNALRRATSNRTLLASKSHLYHSQLLNVCCFLHVPTSYSVFHSLLYKLYFMA